MLVYMHVDVREELRHQKQHTLNPVPPAKTEYVRQYQQQYHRDWRRVKKLLDLICPFVSECKLDDVERYVKQRKHERENLYDYRNVTKNPYCVEQPFLIL